MIQTITKTRAQLRIIIFGLCIILSTKYAHALTDEIISSPKFVPEKDSEMTPPRDEALKWIIDHWNYTAKAIFLEMERQAHMRGHKVDFRNKELSLLVNSKGLKWDGIWAIVVEGKTDTFQSNFSYYVELFKSDLILSNVSGIGYTIGSPSAGKVRSLLRDRSINDFHEYELSKDEIKFISGIWVAKTITDYEQFNTFFKFSIPWKYKELDSSAYLKINNNLTCNITVPHEGLSQNTWNGMVKTYKVNNSGRFLVLADKNTKYTNQGIAESLFISVENENKMSIWTKGEIWEFRRKLKSPTFDLTAIDSLISQRIGVLRPSP